MPEAHPDAVAPGVLAPTILAALEDGVLVSRGGRLVFANPAAERILGVSGGELVDDGAEPRWQLVDLDGRPLALEDGPTSRTVRSGEPRVRDLVGVRRPNGDVRWVEVTTAILPDDAGVLTTLTDATERRQAERELTWVADHDALTGLINRRRFTADLAAELARIRRTGRAGAVVMLDLDRFKEINDSLGHRIGDQLLRHVAAVLTERLRETDVLARLGGDEFAIVLPETPLPAAGDVVRELVGLIADRPMTVEGGDTVRVTASAGVAPLDVVAPATTADDVLVSADLAMYEAKRGGRDAVHVRAPGDDRERVVRRDHERSQRIRRALVEEGFVLHYQPIATLATGRIDAFEALLRMPGDDGVLVPPADVLDVAGRHGLLTAVDRWVVARGVRALGTGVLGDRALSLNVSAASLADARLADLLDDEVATAGVDPGRLQFEITESTAIADPGHAREFCRRVHALGGTVTLDDFGSGFASFRSLKRLPYDAIKVDGEFVGSVTDGPQERLLLEALLSVGRRLSKRTVAEAVEDQATHDLLRELGADAAQGWLIGRPGPPAGALAAARAYEDREALLRGA